jgi:hypothetical protein
VAEPFLVGDLIWRRNGIYTQPAPEHRSALVGLLEHAEQRLEDADRPHKVDAARGEIAVPRAVLGEKST